MDHMQDDVDAIGRAYTVKAFEVGLLSGLGHVMTQLPDEDRSLENIADGLVAAIARTQELDPRVEGMVLERLLARAVSEARA